MHNILKHDFVKENIIKIKQIFDEKTSSTDNKTKFKQVVEIAIKNQVEAINKELRAIMGDSSTVSDLKYSSLHHHIDSFNKNSDFSKMIRAFDNIKKEHIKRYKQRLNKMIN